MHTSTSAAGGRARNRRRRLALAITVAGGCCLAGPLSPGRTATAAPATTSSVAIVTDAFSPAALTVKVGDTVTWTNTDSTPGSGHTVTSKGRGPLKSSSLAQGQAYSFTFTTAGTYAYYCAIHPDMMGTVTAQ
jgi:plastocyanin